MEITVNGERREIAAPKTVAELLAELGIDARRVAVEHNRRILKRSELASTRLADGDVLEIVHFVGGGAGKKKAGAEGSRALSVERP